MAWLHDVVEDSDVTLDELRDDFSDAIVDAVVALTRRDGEGDDYYRRVASNDLAVAVKRADIWDNTNPERLAALPTSTRDRLQAKYAHALALLDQLAPPASATPPETSGLSWTSLVPQSVEGFAGVWVDGGLGVELVAADGDGDLA